MKSESLLLMMLLLLVTPFFFRPNSYYFRTGTNSEVLLWLDGEASYEECFWGRRFSPELQTIYEGCGAVATTSRPGPNASMYWLDNVAPASKLLLFTADPLLRNCLEDTTLQRTACLDSGTQELLGCLQAKLPPSVKRSCPSFLEAMLLVELLDVIDDDDDDDDW